MDITDIEDYIIRYNLDKNSRKTFYIHNRMYLYALLYHKHLLTLEEIGAMFKKNHATVLGALRKADYVQHRDVFIKDVKLLHEQIYFIIPPYKVIYRSKKPKNPPLVTEFMVKLHLNRDSYMEYLKSKSTNEVYDIIWQLTVDKLSTRITSINRNL